MATKKQLAALKKARAARAKNLKKKAPAKKRVVKRKTPVKKRAVKTRARKKAADKKGFRLILKKGARTIAWWNGHAWDDQSINGKFYTSMPAIRRALTAAKKLTPKTGYGIAAEETIKKR